MQIIVISLSTQSVTPMFDAVQYDSARECGFNVQEDISSYDIVEAVFNISQGVTVTSQCLVNEHLITFFVPINVTRQAGVFTATVRFITGGAVIHAFPFKVDVAQNPSPDGNVYERAYEDMIAENERADANNTQMEAFISAYGSITPSQLTSLLSDLQTIWANFNGQDMTSLANAISAVDDKADANTTSITQLQTLTSSHTSSINTLNTNVSGLTTRIGTAESDIDTLETLANSAVYHD